MPKNPSRGYDPKSEKPFTVSRTAIDVFVKCPRCFYLQRRLGITPPKSFPLSLNLAVDELLKKEFDAYRKLQKPHPLMVEHKINAVPFAHPDLEAWRHNFTGVQFLHKRTNLLVTGAVDDLWINDKKELIVVDYKATAKTKEAIYAEGELKDAYCRQFEVYQWLLRQNGFKVSNTAYWVYANGDKSKKSFDANLSFEMLVISYEGNDDWVEERLLEIKSYLESEKIPEAASDCQMCKYVGGVGERVGGK